MRKIMTGIAVASLVVIGTTAPAEAAPVKKYQNCKKLNAVYKHGVGKKGARDKTSGDPVTDFRRNNKVYAKNTHLDRDKDKIACEKH